MRDGEALQKVNRQLLGNVSKHAFLLVERRLVSANESTILGNFEAAQDFWLLAREAAEELGDLLLSEV